MVSSWCSGPSPRIDRTWHDCQSCVTVRGKQSRSIPVRDRALLGYPLLGHSPSFSRYRCAQTRALEPKGPLLAHEACWIESSCPHGRGTAEKAPARREDVRFTQLIVPIEHERRESAENDLRLRF